MIVVRTMLGLDSWHVVWKVASKEMRASRGKWAAVAAVLALSISAMSGVGGSVEVSMNALHQNSRASLAGDLCADSSQELTEDQATALDALRAEGIEWTLVTMTLTMASSSESPDASFASVKVVDPEVYPFYGGSKPLAALANGGVVVSRYTLRRLRVRAGDSIRLGGAQFRIAGVMAAEPEQVFGILSRGVRCILSRKSYESTGLARAGSTAKYRVLLRLAAGADLGAAKQKLQAVLPDSIVLDCHDVNRNLGFEIETVRTYLGVTALLALVLGSVGIAAGVRYQVERRMPVFATMRMLGARNSQLIAVFLIEIGSMIVAALPLGVALGWIVTEGLVSAALEYIPLQSVGGGSAVRILEALAASIFATIPATAGPIWTLCHLRPAIVLRSQVVRAESPPRSILWMWSVLVLIAFSALAGQMLGSWKKGLQFSVGLLFAGALAFSLASLSLRLLAFSKGLPRSFRLGIGNLVRPGNRASLVISVIAAGVMMLVATVESSHAVTDAAKLNLPYDLTNSLLIAGFEDSNGQQIRGFAQSLQEVESFETKTQARLQLRAVDGRSTPAAGWYFAKCSGGGLTLNHDLQRRLGVVPGSTLDFYSAEREISMTVVAIAKEKFAFPIAMNCDQVGGAGLFRQAVIQARPGELAQVEDAIRQKFPMLAVITLPEMTAVLQELTRNGQVLAGFVTWYFVTVGLAILTTVVAASRLERARETGVLSALGAPPALLVKIYTVEFAVVGAVAGIIGSAAACVIATLSLGLIFGRWELTLDRWIALIAFLGSILLTTAAGWLPTYSLLRERPMNVLRRP